MADRSLTLVFLGKDVSAGATAETLAAKLKALEAATDDNTKASNRLTNSLDNTNKRGFKPILDSVLFLGPALVPIGAAAAGAAVGLAGLGAAGLLAFTGIRREMEQGTALGKQYEGAFKPIIDEYHTLGTIAAGHVFEGLNRGIESSKKLFPELATDVANLSDKLGSIAGHVGAGLVGLFHALAPLFDDVAKGIDNGAAAFERWATQSDGPKRFVEYARQQLPVVVGALKNFGEALAHIAVAAAPLGGATLQAFSALASAISRIPVPILTGLILALEVGRLGQITGAIGNLAGAFTRLSGGIGGAGVAAGGFAGILGPLALGIGAIAAVGTLLVNKLNEGRLNFDKIAGSAKGFASALNATNGTIDASVIKSVALQLQQTGVADKAKKAGVNLTQLTGAITGTDQEMNDLIATMRRNGGSSKELEFAVISLHKQFGNQAAAARDASNAVAELSAEYRAVPRNVQTYLKTIDGATGVIRGVDGQLRAIDGRVVYTTIVTQHTDIFTVQDAASNRGPAGVTSHAAGGHLGEGWNMINELGPEWLYKSGSQVKVYPHGTGGPSGAAVGTSIAVNINVAGSVTSERNLVSAVRAGIRDQLRSEGKLATVV